MALLEKLDRSLIWNKIEHLRRKYNAAKVATPKNPKMHMFSTEEFNLIPNRGPHFGLGFILSLIKSILVLSSKSLSPSRHNDKGDRINDTTTAGDTSVLLPVQDGAVSDCRSSGVKFVRVQLELDFADLTIVAAAANAPNVILRGEYYIQLPQSSRDLLNGNQVANSLFDGQNS